MKLIAIQFTEWRDPGDTTHVAVETASKASAAAVAKLTSLKSQIGQQDELLKIAQSTAVDAKRSELAAQLPGVVDEIAAARAAEQQAEADAMAAIKKHPMVGKTGYQVLDDAGETVLKVVDADGNDLPDGVVYGYVFTAAVADNALPSWGIAVQAAAVTAAKEAQ